MAESECPECTFHIILPPNAKAGQVIECPDCGAALEVVSVAPTVLRVIQEEGEW